MHYNAVIMKKPFNMRKTVRYVLSFAAYAFITFADGNFTPFSLGLLLANVYVGLNPALSFALYTFPFLLSFDITVLWTAFVGGSVVAVSAYLLKTKKAKGYVFLCSLFAGISAVPYVVFSAAYDSVLIRAIFAGVIAVSVFPMIAAAKVWLIKGLRYRVSTDEFISAAALLCAVGYGAVSISGEYPWFAISTFTVMLSASLLGGFVPLMFALIAALPPSLYYASFTPLAVYALISLAPIAFSGYSPLLTAIGAVAIETVLYFLTSAFNGMTAYQTFFLLAPCLIYAFIPQDKMKKLNKKLRIFRNDNLGRYNVNRTRASLSSKLYEASAAFDEMSSSMAKLGKVSRTEADLKAKTADEILYSVCAACPSQAKCRGNGFPDSLTLDKIITLGAAKGDLNLVDLPRVFTEECDRPESVVIKLNSLLKEYARGVAESEALESGRSLVVAQTKGLAEILKSMAARYSRRLEDSYLLEKKITDNLFTCGIYVSEILVFGGDDAEINVVMPSANVASPYFLKAVSEVVGYDLVISYRENVSAELSAVTLTRAPKLDAAFGIAARTKSDKTKSGDTHSISRLSAGKFLVALNDGMGSGRSAEDVSATAISLVETFYKSGLSSDLVLSTVNKALTFNREDDFTAMDLGIVDLYDGKADFIKIGTPYSFVITKDSVKIIEGNSLPLGILDEMRPTVCKTELKSGDTIVFVSDGISDAFGSASDLIDFLTTEKAINPKSLAENIMDKALSLTDGIARDDMTAFCVRIFDKAS